MPGDRALGGEFYNSHEPRETAPVGRLCSFRGCKTELSIYNLTDRCSRHKHANILVFGKARKPKEK